MSKREHALLWAAIVLSLCLVGIVAFWLGTKNQNLTEVTSGTGHPPESWRHRL